MRILFSSTSYPRSAEDWRGRFILDMVDALAARPGLSLASWMPPGPALPGVRDACSEEERKWLDQLARNGGIAHALRSGPVRAASGAFGLMRRLRAAYRRESWDVAHVNWLQNALPLPAGKPAVISVLGTDYGLLRLPGMTAMLRRMLTGRRAILAPNAAWMMPELERCFGDLAQVRAIPFGVHDRWFAVERQACTQPRPWLVVSRITRAKLGHLVDWGEGLFGPDRPLVLLGPMQEAMVLPAWITQAGPTHPEALARDWFPGAAGILTLSTHDEGRPQILLDAMAAALPIIASDLAAHRDLLRHGDTGWLAASREQLAQGLTTLEGHEGIRLGQAARRWIKTEIGDWSDCAERYVRAYRETLGDTA